MSTWHDPLKNYGLPLKIMINISGFNMNERLVAVLSSVFSLRKEQIVPELTKDMVSKWDSLTQMDLVVSIEQEFSITLEITDILKMSSVAGILEVLQGRGVDLGH